MSKIKGGDRKKKSAPFVARRIIYVSFNDSGNKQRRQCPKKKGGDTKLKQISGTIWCAVYY